MTTEFVVLENTRRHLGRARAQLGSLLGGLVEHRSEGARLWTTDGREFLNCGGYGVFLLGARHPRVVDAVTEQLNRHPVGTRGLLEAAAAGAAAALAEVAPAGLTKVYFAGAGTEATEAALKMAAIQGRTRLIGAAGGYHGKTLGALSLTANDTYQGPFRGLLHGASRVPYGDATALEEALGRDGSDACVVLEPIQGEGGVIVPPAGYLAQVQRLCRERGAMLVLDEIMTGLGRTGTWWRGEIERITPDVLLVGKSLGGGVLPVSAAIATEQAYAAFDADLCLHTSTFSAAPLGMAAAAATLAVLREEDLVGASARIGARLHTALTEIRDRTCPRQLVDIRGAGTLFGLEFADAGLAGEFLLEMLDARVIVNHSLNAGPVLRLTPPATLQPLDEAWLLEAFDKACVRLAAHAN
ncbi:aspartate aminotransferase family protein [Nocardia barduliensis]|uniref:aspartate aminotransferase family protein n=1 Tax=Nocardia barduliensis TaxID=2736643 RepID=UPI00157297E3|nr:aspartate aminotransferase family protein [Nocardia barduliensis]